MPYCVRLCSKLQLLVMVACKYGLSGRRTAYGQQEVESGRGAIDLFGVHDAGNIIGINFLKS